MAYLENDVLSLNTVEVPLTSSNTQSSTVNEGGRPSNASGGKQLSDAGEVTADRQEE